jgi:hypothetical protein
MSQKNVYKIGKIHQLYDLNNDALNFICNFRIMAESPQKHFEYLVISQEQLDSDDSLPEFNKAEGVGVGRVVSDKGTHQNFFLALRSNEDQSVTVEMQFEKLPDDYHLTSLQQQQQQQPQPQQQPQQPQQQPQQPNDINNSEQYDNNVIVQNDPNNMDIQYPDQYNSQIVNNGVQNELFATQQNIDNESFLSKMFKSKIVWFILTVSVLIAVYFMFFSVKSERKDNTTATIVTDAAVSTGAAGASKPNVKPSVVDGSDSILSKAATKQSVVNIDTSGVNVKSGGLNIDDLNKLAH